MSPAPLQSSLHHRLDKVLCWHPLLRLLNEVQVDHRPHILVKDLGLILFGDLCDGHPSSPEVVTADVLLRDCLLLHLKAPEGVINHDILIAL